MRDKLRRLGRGLGCAAVLLALATPAAGQTAAERLVRTDGGKVVGAAACVATALVLPIVAIVCPAALAAGIVHDINLQEGK